MSKPLELTITDYSDGPLDLFGSHFNRHRADQIAARKRLTEVELCAEFEAARCDSMIQSQTGRCWQPLGYTWPMDEESIRSRAQTLLRFASAPHYFEQE